MINILTSHKKSIDSTFMPSMEGKQMIEITQGFLLKLHSGRMTHMLPV